MLPVSMLGQILFFGGSSLRSVHIILFLCYHSGEAVLTCTQSVEGMGRYISTGDVW